MEREIEKPEINMESSVLEKQEVKQENVLEKERKAEDPEKKKKEIEEVLSSIKTEDVSNITSTYNQDAIVSRLVKVAIAEGPEAIRGELNKITDPYIIDQVHDQLMKYLNK